MTPDVGQTAVSTQKEIVRLICLINISPDGQLFIVNILSQPTSPELIVTRTQFVMTHVEGASSDELYCFDLGDFAVLPCGEN